VSKVVKKVREVLSRAPAFGAASPDARVVYETADILLVDVMKLYDRDPTCKSSIDLLAASTVGTGFYTTCEQGQEKAKEAVDKFCEDVNLDGLLNDMARRLIACGNDFWLKLKPERLVDLVRMPVNAVEKIKLAYVKDLKIPWKADGYILKSDFGEGFSEAGRTLKPEAVIHWRFNSQYHSGFGIGLLQVLLHTLTINSDKRPAYAWMKSKIERIMPKIFEKYAGPDVIVQLEGQKPETIKAYENAIKNRPEEGLWLFSGAKNVSVNPVQLDPRARFEYYIDHIINQFYLGCETPLPRLFSTPGFTEASANAALELQDMLVKPVQRYVKRQVERDIFAPILTQAGYDPALAKVRLNFGSPETPELLAADLIAATEKGFIRTEEFRKNAVKVLGWELWEKSRSSTDARSNVSGGEGT
jgi:hypothetical protein